VKVRSGLDVLLADRLDLLEAGRVGVIANPSSVDSRLTHMVDLLFAHTKVNLTAIFGPQHGARGETQDNMIEWQDYRDPLTRLPVFSLYGPTRVPTESMLSEVDLLVFDVQDVGARYYTFIYTMALAMEACGRLGKRFIVLDRPNPVNGRDVEGPILDPEFTSFVGLYPLPVRHGMTVGELALYFNSEFQLGCDLEVVKMEGWQRRMYFEETGLPWVLPSPNIPTPDTAMVYPGLCLLEGTNVSEGRGTTRPFELSGAPWIEPSRMAKILSEMQLPGAIFRPVHFIPTFHKWNGQIIGGVQIHVTSRDSFRPFLTGLSLVKLYRDLGGSRFAWNEPPYEYEFEKLPFDILCGTDRIRKRLEAGAPVPEIAHSWQDELKDFRPRREKYLLYP
jgi:uncharacterized protein YbbC (DUF1343 family)